MERIASRRICVERDENRRKSRKVDESKWEK